MHSRARINGNRVFTACLLGSDPLRHEWLLALAANVL
jgi:hypothetical protein